MTRGVFSSRHLYTISLSLVTYLTTRQRAWRTAALFWTRTHRRFHIRVCLWFWKDRLLLTHTNEYEANGCVSASFRTQNERFPLYSRHRDAQPRNVFNRDAHRIKPSVQFNGESVTAQTWNPLVSFVRGKASPPTRETTETLNKSNLELF